MSISGLFLIVIGALSGVAGGLVGIGGGVIIIPVLTRLLHFTQHTAQGTTLAMMIPPIGILAVLNYYRSGMVDIRAAAFLALGFLIGGLVGSQIAISLPTATLQKVFGVAVILIGLQMIFK